MEAVAKLNNCPVSARKMRLLANQIRGMQVDRALNTLKFNQRRQYAIRLEKLLVSAINNWEKKNEGQSIADSPLFIKTVFVDGGPMLKRISPAPQGRAYRIRKRSNHVTLIVDTKEEKN